MCVPRILLGPPGPLMAWRGLQQPADFMTKLTSGNGVNAWVGYITNVRNAVLPAVLEA